MPDWTLYIGKSVVLSDLIQQVWQHIEPSRSPLGILLIFAIGRPRSLVMVVSGYRHSR